MAEQKVTTVPSVLEFTSAHEYLRAVYQAKKSSNPKYSVRAFATKLQIAGSGNLSLVLNGKRPLPLILANSPQVTRSMNPAELTYWQLLCCSKKIISPESLDHVRKVIKKNETVFVAHRERRNIDVKIFREWLAFYVFHFDALNTTETQVSELLAELPAKQHPMAKKVLNDFEKEGILSVNDGKIFVLDKYLAVPAMGRNQEVRNHHRMILCKAEEAIDRYDTSDRWFESSFISLPEDKIATLFREIAEFHKHILSFAVEKGAGAVVQVSSQAFPVKPL